MSSNNKHLANPDFKSGDNWVVCDVCGMDIYASDSKKRWDGLLVCPEDFEIRHSQDFVRARKDKIRASIVTGQTVDIFVDVPIPSAVAGIAIAGRAIAGYRTSEIPTGTFNPNTL